MKSLKALGSLLLFSLLLAPVTNAADARELRSNSESALERLYSINPKARALGEKAYAILVFPTVIKAGFMVGGQRGDGVLFQHGRVAGYYNTTSASFGIQAGVQSFSYALFFMTKDDMKDLNKSGGFNLGASPSLVVADKGVAGDTSVYTLQGIKAFIFGQKGLMAGLGLQGTKISQYTPSE
jgi:lipid-binding SYLF domain-containing protein